jgi:MFS family permease
VYALKRLQSVNTLFPRTLKWFLGGMILANVAVMMYDPLLPLYIQHLGANVSQVGLFFTISAILPLVFQIFGGWLSDSIGRLKAIAIGSVASLFTFVIFMIAPGWKWALLAMVGGAIGRSFVAPSYRAFIAEQSDENNRGKIFGFSDGIFAVVGVLGPPLGGWLSDTYGYRMLFLVAGIVFVFATIVRVSMAVSEEQMKRQKFKVLSPQAHEISKPSWQNLKSSMGAMVALLLTGGVATWILISDGIIDINFNLVGQLMPIYMQNELGISNTQIGLLNSISSIVTMVLMTFTGWLSDKKGERMAIAGGLAILFMSMTVFVLAGSFFSLAISWALFGIGNSMLGPAYSSLISKAVPEKLRGIAFGLFSTSVGVVALPAPYIGAYLYETFNPRLPFILPTIALLAVIPIAWKKFRLDKPETNPPQITAAQAD